MKYNADRRLIGTCLVVIAMLSFGAFATPEEKIPTDNEGYSAYMVGKTFGYFLAHPSGALVKPFMERISTTGNTQEDFDNIQQLLLPAIANANRITIEKLKIDIVKLEKDVKAAKKAKARRQALELAESLVELVSQWRSVKSFDEDALPNMAKQAKEFLEKEAKSELSSQWISANRLAGFTNSLSNHATAFGVDLQAATKLAPEGIGILYGQKEGMNHHGKSEPLWEMNRHLGANNELVKMASWGNIIGTGLRVPLHHGKNAFAAGNYTQAVSDVFNHYEEFGMYRLAADSSHEVAETLRGLFWLVTLSKHKEAWLAKDAAVKWIGELGPASRRLRKFVQLHPHGNLYLFTFQNAIAIPMFFLDFQEGYVGVLGEQWESLGQKQPGSGEFYSEALNMGLTAVGPYMAGLHLYLHGFGKTVKPGLENSVARHFYNGFQYSTYALIQSAIHLNMFADFAADTMGYTEGTSRYAAKAGSATVAGFGVLGLYNGYFGQQPRAVAQTWVPRAVKVLLYDNILSNIIGAATGDSHYSALRSLFKLPGMLYAKIQGGSDEQKQEL